MQAKRTVAKNNPLSYINVLGDLAVKEGRKPGQDDPFGGLTGQVGCGCKVWCRVLEVGQ